MPRTKRPPETGGLSYRAVDWRPETLNAEERTIDGIAATEGAVQVYDWQRDQMVSEVLLMTGLEIRGGADRVPLLNNHQRSDCRDVIGSADNLRIDGNQLRCRARFSAQAADIFARVQEGHVRALSIGYRVRRVQYVPSGQTASISGRDFSGPMNVVTSWELREVSVTPIGADPETNLRGLATEDISMLTAEQRATLETRGMPKDLDDAAAIQWAVDHPAQRTEPPVPAPTIPTAADLAEQLRNAAAKAAADEVRRIADETRTHAEEVRILCDLAGLPDMAAGFISERTALPTVKLKLQEAKATRQKDLPFTVERLDAGASRNDKFFGAIGAALNVRALEACHLPAERVNHYMPEAQRAAGWEQFRRASLFDLARECVEADGFRTRGLARQDIAIVALGCGEQIGIRAETGFHSTGSFANLTRDAFNKSLLAGYAERPMSWRTVFRQAPSVPDFKNIHRVRLSEAPNLSIWIDGKAPEQAALTDEREYYAVEAYAEEVSFSWKLLINDDMDALSRIPQMLGTAAARTVNALVWSVLTSNPTLQDGVALFSAATGNRKKANTTTGAITVANLGAARSIMRLQVGVNTKGGNASPAILNLTPRYLVVPAAIETTAQQVINSTYDPVANAPSGVFNPFSGGSLQLVVEPLLDAASATQWYAIASVSDVDTLETSFLQGQETPFTNTYRDDKTLAQTYQVIQSFGVKAIDFRGMVRSTGT